MGWYRPVSSRWVDSLSQMSNSQSEQSSTISSATTSAGTGAKKPSWGWSGEFAKWTAVILIFLFCTNMLRKKLSGISLADVWNGVANTPIQQLALAVIVTAINFVVLTGYDWIAIEYLKKKLPIRKIMTGAVIGYAFSNVFGWMFGGTTVRYRLYTRWGFSFLEVLAFITILSVTFWLGMFLLAGIAFVTLPVRLPEQYAEHLPLTPEWFGYLFLAVVLAYLLAAILIHKPIRIGNHYFSFPPFRLSLVQLSVSAIDFALASLVLYLLLPDVSSIGYGTVLVSYIAAMVVTVLVHVPGGFGVLELIVLDILTKDVPEEQRAELVVGVTCGIVLFRLIYYFIPGGIAGLLFLKEEME